MVAKSVEGAKDLVDRDDHLGWLVYTLCPGGVLPTATVRLRYTLGPWEGSRQFTPDQNGIVALGNGSQFNGVGQDLDGKAFFAIAVDMKQDSGRQFGVVAVAKDGRELTWSKVDGGGGTGQAVHVERFHYAASLADIRHFRLSTRPVRSVDFQNASLANKPSPVQSRQSPGLASVDGNEVVIVDAKKAKELQHTSNQHLGVPVEITNSIGMKLVLIPPGEFMMGSPKELIEEELKTPAMTSGTRSICRARGRSTGCGSPSRFTWGCTW